VGIITKMLKQTAAYWPPTGTDKRGQPTLGTPIDILVRWEDKTEEFIDPATGTRQMSKAIVYVDRDVLVHGVLLLDGLTSTTDQDNAKANDGAWEIRRFEKLPTLRQTKAPLRTVFL